MRERHLNLKIRLILPSFIRRKANKLQVEDEITVLSLKIKKNKIIQIKFDFQ